MNDILNIINQEHKTGVIMGDMNIDLLKFKSNDKTNSYLDTLFSNGFLPLITKPTRVGPTSSTLIDHIYSNNKLVANISGVIINDVADHYGTFCTFPKRKQKHKQNTYTTRLINEDTIEMFQNKLSMRNFDTIAEIPTVNECYEKFLELYIDVFDSSFPITTKRCKRKQRQPWMTPELIKLSKKKAKLFNRKQKNPSVENVTEYKTYNNMYNQKRKTTKKCYYHNLLINTSNDIKKTWETLNEVIGRNAKNCNSPTNLNINGKLITGDTEVANAFNEYFINAGKNIIENIPKLSQNFYSYLPNSSARSMFIDPVTTYEVASIIQHLKPKKSSGLDEISCYLIRLSYKSILEPLTYVFNQSLGNGIFPDKMKCAKVIPIFKNGDQTIVSNDRPVSLLSAFSKIIVRLMYNRVLHFLNRNDIFYKHQYEFRPKH